MVVPEKVRRTVCFDKEVDIAIENDRKHINRSKFINSTFKKKYHIQVTNTSKKVKGGTKK